MLDHTQESPRVTLTVKVKGKQDNACCHAVLLCFLFPNPSLTADIHTELHWCIGSPLKLVWHEENKTH